MSSTVPSEATKNSDGNMRTGEAARDVLGLRGERGRPSGSRVMSTERHTKSDSSAATDGWENVSCHQLVTPVRIARPERDEDHLVLRAGLGEGSEVGALEALDLSQVLGRGGEDCGEGD